MAPSSALPDDTEESEIGQPERDAIRAALEESLAVIERLRMSLEAVDVDGLTLDGFLELRARLGMLWGELDHQARTITVQFGFGGALDCLRIFMLNHIGEPVENYELAGVACALEWARRKRQLVVQDGWTITTGGPRTEGLSVGQYRLESDTPDGSRAERWSLLNGIRRQHGGALARILVLLRGDCPNAVSRDDLNYVAKIQSRERRVRDLEESGWDIRDHDDDPSIPDGWYRLVSLEKGPPRSREAIKRRKELLQDRNHTCEECGARPEKARKAVVLQIHHRIFVSEGGTNDENNLEVVCRECHAGIHALSESRVEDELLYPAADPYREVGL